MTVKIIDNFFYTKLSHDSAKALIEKLLEEHIRELSDFDMEHFIEVLEETDKFESIEEEDGEEIELEITQDQIDELVNDILEEDYDMEEDDEDEDEEEELDMDDEDEEDDGEGWD